MGGINEEYRMEVSWENPWIREYYKIVAIKKLRPESTIWKKNSETKSANPQWGKKEYEGIDNHRGSQASSWKTNPIKRKDDQGLWGYGVKTKNQAQRKILNSLIYWLYLRQ